MGRVDRMDQNISAYMINLRQNKWWWPFFWFLVDVAVNKTDKIYCQSHLILENIYWMPLGFAEPLLMRTITSIGIVCHLQNYSQVVTACIPLQTNYSLTISIAGFLRVHSDSVIYEDVTEPGYIIANVGLHVGCFELYHCN